MPQMWLKLIPTASGYGPSLPQIEQFSYGVKTGIAFQGYWRGSRFARVYPKLNKFSWGKDGHSISVLLKRINISLLYIWKVQCLCGLDDPKPNFL